MLPRLAIAVLLSILLGSLPALADAPSKVYVSTGAGGQILAVVRSTTSVIHTAPTTIGDLTLGPDGLLYASLASGIIRLDPNATVAREINQSVEVVYMTHPAGPAELRFSSSGHLYFNASSGGVWRVRASDLAQPMPSAGVDPEQVAATAGGSGLAFTHGGNLIVSSRSASGAEVVTGVPVEASSYSFSLALSARSLAVAAGGEQTESTLSTGEVVAASGDTIRTYSKGGTERVLAQFAGQRVGHLEVDADDRVFATTFVSEALSNTANGRLWVCTGSGCQSLAATPRRSGKFAPMVGIALAPTARTIEHTFANTGPTTFDFGSHFLRITGTVHVSRCPMRVSSLALTPAAAAGLLGPAYTAIPYLGEEGFVTAYDIATQCEFSSEKDIFVAAFSSGNTNPRIVRCPDHAESEASACHAVPLFGFYATGPLGAEDPAYGAKTTDNFSRWLIVNEGLVNAGQSPTFCGLESPFPASGAADLVLNTGSNVTLKFRLAAPGGTCASGPYVSTALPLISIARVSPSYFAVPLPAASGNSNEPPTARYDSRSGQYIYNLNLTGYAAGRYEVTVTDLGSLFPAVRAAYFKVSASGGGKK